MLDERELTLPDDVRIHREALEQQAVADRRNIATLQDALASSRRIGAAIGIVMATLKITEDAAFDRLRQASQHGNRKLREIADDVVRTGAVPGSSD